MNLFGADVKQPLGESVKEDMAVFNLHNPLWFYSSSALSVLILSWSVCVCLVAFKEQTLGLAQGLVDR